MKFGISDLTVVPIRKDPSDKSEMVSQLLFGEHFKITEGDEKWSKIIVSHDNYSGWICNKQIRLIKEETYNKLKNVKPNISTKLFDVVIKNDITQIISAGSIMPNYKDGISFIENEKFIFKGTVKKQGKENIEKIVDVTMVFLNTPYLWGGRTAFGIDCSGLVQIAYRLIGINLPRDASQQIEYGNKITDIKKSKIGDLAFFNNEKGEIIHVGILIGKNKIIHASGKVRIDNLDKKGIFNKLANNYTHTLNEIKRIL